MPLFLWLPPPPKPFEIKFPGTLPDAIQNECKPCSEKQKAGSKKVIEYLIDNKADSWKELEKKYDPDGSYRIKYEKTAKKEGIDINKKDGA